MQVMAKTEKGAIEYRFEGSGPTIVVLNGGHCSRDSRFSHEKLAVHGFSVLTPSRPGYDNTPSAVGKTAQAAADAIALLLDQLQIPTVDVIGISAASPTALAFAQQHPNRLRKLVLESAITAPWEEGVKSRSRPSLWTHSKPYVENYKTCPQVHASAADTDHDERTHHAECSLGHAADESGRFTICSSNDPYLSVRHWIYERY